MSDYNKATNFTAKDSLITGDPNKIVYGSELDTEYTAIETAIATKANTASPTFTGTVTLPAVVHGGNESGNRTDSGNITFSGTIVLGNTTSLTGDISPAQITANQNDYNPTNLASSTVLRLDADADDWDITGIQGGSDGRVLTLINVGSFYIRLVDDATSTAANRFQLGGDILLLPNTSITLWYDSTSSRWRVFSSPDEAIGVRQTWQDLTGSRAINTVYQNTTGKPIEVSACLLSSAIYQASLMVGTANPPTIIVARIGVDTSTIITQFGPVIVPPNHYYELLIDSGTTPTLSKWAELR